MLHLDENTEDAVNKELGLPLTRQRMECRKPDGFLHERLFRVMEAEGLINDMRLRVNTKCQDADELGLLRLEEHLRGKRNKVDLIISGEEPGHSQVSMGFQTLYNHEVRTLINLDCKGSSTFLFI